MRLWTLHPRYLDTQGLLAAWREGLLAQKVLRGETRGYRHHPQLARFRAQADPLAAISTYLRALHDESQRRGYNFAAEKIAACARLDAHVRATRGQLLYEWAHLKRKLAARDPRRLEELSDVAEPDAHPLFEIVEGGVEDWEVLAGD